MKKYIKSKEKCSLYIQLRPYSHWINLKLTHAISNQFDRERESENIQMAASQTQNVLKSYTINLFNGGAAAALHINCVCVLYAKSQPDR